MHKNRKAAVTAIPTPSEAAKTAAEAAEAAEDALKSIKEALEPPDGARFARRLVGQHGKSPYAARETFCGRAHTAERPDGASHACAIAVLTLKIAVRAILTRGCRLSGLEHA